MLIPHNADMAAATAHQLPQDAMKAASIVPNTAKMNPIDIIAKNLAVSIASPCRDV
jgi:hypothetical protein